MRKIDKSEILSIAYKEWEKNLKDENHPKYSSSHKYYLDIKLSLLYCQKGLCAYTEEVLCDPKFINIDNWNEQEYSKVLTKENKYEIKGDLEHFDESLKVEFGFSWDNLFVVNSHNNCRIKGRKPIKNILKPDNKDYSPYKYLEFFMDNELDNYIFIPNSELSEIEKEDVAYMIEVLGLNCIEYDRRKQIREWLDKADIGLPVDPYRYITAWEMASP
jgi:hypothetical protein